ncbi:hypothetical protein GCM10009627_23750 [Curtobacterium herbarum]|uniref:Uncharacterized protein n=1 Tax=Curtobacterium herbarum TaxID=150122 RepID=A0ABN1ZFW2_9MICO
MLAWVGAAGVGVTAFVPAREVGALPRSPTTVVPDWQPVNAIADATTSAVAMVALVRSGIVTR